MINNGSTCDAREREAGGGSRVRDWRDGMGCRKAVGVEVATAFCTAGKGIQQGSEYYVQFM
jgi:hypothetical protein